MAIFPISDQSGDAQLAASGIGRILTDAFVQLLADDPSLYVVSPHRLAGITRAMGRTISETDTDLDLARETALQSDSGAMLTGTLSHLGETYFLAATLTELPSGIVMEQFRVQSENVESLLTELTGEMSLQMRDRFATATGVTDSTRRSKPIPTQSIQAYGHYVQGDDLIQEGKWDAAIRELREAVEIDPEMALAWSSLSCAYSFASEDTYARASAMKAREYLDSVNEREQRWIELDNIWVNTGNGDLYLERMADYIRDYPDDRDSYFYAGLAEEHLRNDPESALAWYEKAHQLIPVFYPVSKAIVDGQLKLGRPDLAVEALRRYLAQPHLDPEWQRQAQARLAELESQP